MRSVFSAFAALVLLAGASFAADPAPAPAETVSPARMALARELVQANGIIEMFDFENLMGSVKKMAPAMVNVFADGAGVDMTPEEKEKAQNMVSEVFETDDMQKLFKLMKGQYIAVRPQLIEKVAAIYAKRFTEDEMKVMIAFYNTDAGKHLVADSADVQMEVTVEAIPLLFGPLIEMMKEGAANENDADDKEADPEKK